MCRVYANNHHNIYVNNFASANLFAASEPTWTQWYSYSDRFELEDYPLINEELMGHEWSRVYDHKTDFEQERFRFLNCAFLIKLLRGCLNFNKRI